MEWIAPAQKDTATKTLEKQLWDAADNLRANSGLTAAQYSQPVLGLIFLKFADARFQKRRDELGKAATGRRGSRVDDPGSYHAEGVLYLQPHARYGYLLEYPEGGKDKVTLGQAVEAAMKVIEADNTHLAGVLPKTYQGFNARLLKELLKAFAVIPDDLEGDAFGKIYEYFLAEFAMTEGQGGGEFYTPTSIVRLLVEVLEPFGGKVLDPACGSGGMFVQSARFVAEHKKGSAQTALAIHGIEKVDDTGRLCRMNLAVHGLEGDIRHGGDLNAYYDDPHNQAGRFDFVLANPPFNVDKVDKERLEGAALPVRSAKAGQRKLPLDPAVLRRLEPYGPCRLRDGQLGVRRTQLGAGASQEADRGAGRRCHGLGRAEHVLHGHAAGDVVVPRPRQAGKAAGSGVVRRRTQRLPADRSCAPRLDRRAGRVLGEPRAAVPRRGDRPDIRRRRGCGQAA